ncbi:hypothetical protein AB5J72_44990 [Streptomyces sp. CG1]|uniref:hypothetical protein n=1 Tax=Streptomyces sp. CG1 TaxID=1287523 RepID=UPI0034E2AA14
MRGTSRLRADVRHRQLAQRPLGDGRFADRGAGMRSARGDDPLGPLGGLSDRDVRRSGLLQ